MKKIALLMAVVLLAALFCGTLSGCGGSDRVTINVFNWTSYIDDEIMDVNRQFEKETGIRVNYKNYGSNEEMYTMLESGAAEYDVVFPSDYMIGKMIKNDMLAKLNFDNIPNYKYIGEDYKNLAYDPNNEYSVPYTWGTVGIFYNKKYVAEEDLKDGWGLLWNEKYKGKIYMFDNSRDAFAIALKKLGYSMNSENPDEWRAAYEELLKQKPLLQGYFMDQVFQKMINEEGWIAPYYSGDGAIMIDAEDGNKDIGYFVPEQGTNFFVDAMCVMKTTKNQEAAEKYIDFLCRTDVAKANAEYICYSTPQTEARAQLDPEVGENPIYYPDSKVLENTEVFLTLTDDIHKLERELWIELKAKKVD